MKCRRTVFAVDLVLVNLPESFRKWAETGNPFFKAANSDLPATLTLMVLSLILYFIGREILPAGRKNDG
ncbi:MAG: hypothetical protein ABJA66_18815 [Actinomycetota bacterium]